MLDLTENQSRNIRVVELLVGLQVVLATVSLQLQGGQGFDLVLTFGLFRDLDLEVAIPNWIDQVHNIIGFIHDTIHNLLKLHKR